MTAELRELLGKATPGPWVTTPSSAGFRIGAPAKIAIAACRQKYRSAESRAVARNNAALIVAAVNALPGLIDERDALRAELAAAREVLRDNAESLHIIARREGADPGILLAAIRMDAAARAEGKL